MKTTLIFISFLMIAEISLSQNIKDSLPEKKLLTITDSLNFESEASFPGGLQEWSKYLSKNINGDIPQKNRAPIGRYRVIVKFAIDKNGTINDIQKITSNGYGMEEEVIRVLKAAPKWAPAYQRGRYVSSYRTQPITFTVN